MRKISPSPIYAAPHTFASNSSGGTTRSGECMIVFQQAHFDARRCMTRSPTRTRCLARSRRTSPTTISVLAGPCLCVRRNTALTRSSTRLGADRHRVGDVIVRAGLQRVADTVVVSKACQHDDTKIKSPVCAIASGFHARDNRHDHIEHNQIGPLLGYDLVGHSPVGGFVDLIPVLSSPNRTALRIPSLSSATRTIPRDSAWLIERAQSSTRVDTHLSMPVRSVLVMKKRHASVTLATASD